MTLIEIALAIGIISFCLVALIGLFPIMLDTVGHSRERALSYRIYQIVATELRSQPPNSTTANLSYDFDGEAFPAESGNEQYRVTVETSFPSALPPDVSNPSLTRARITIKNTVTKDTLLRRAIWVVKHD